MSRSLQKNIFADDEAFLDDDTVLINVPIIPFTKCESVFSVFAFREFITFEYQISKQAFYLLL